MLELQIRGGCAPRQITDAIDFLLASGALV
jgi:hypothetical protein